MTKSRYVKKLKSNLPSSSPSQKAKESSAKVNMLNYYYRLKQVNKIAKELSPDGKLYANFQKQAAKLFDDFSLKKADIKNTIFKKSLIKDIDSFLKKTKKKRPAPFTKSKPLPNQKQYPKKPKGPKYYNV